MVRLRVDILLEEALLLHLLHLILPWKLLEALSLLQKLLQAWHEIMLGKNGSMPMTTLSLGDKYLHRISDLEPPSKAWHT